MHVAAANPTFVSREDVDAAALESEKDLYRQQAIAEGKPEQIVERIVEGKVKRYYSDVCLLEQGFVKDPDHKVGDMITDAIAKIGENIVVRRFARLAVGESEATLAETHLTSTTAS